MQPANGLHVTRLCRDTPQRPEKRSGAGDALFSATPSALLPRARGSEQNGPARTLNQRSWLHVQAMKADKPRLSACPSKVIHPPPLFRVRPFALAISLAARASPGTAKRE